MSSPNPCTPERQSDLSDKRFHKGDEVEWKSHGASVRGTVEREITSDTEAAGRTVCASNGDPQYHKPDALRPAD